MKKIIFPLKTSCQSSGSELFSALRMEEKKYLAYLEQVRAGKIKDKMTDAEMHACDHCEAPWLCTQICFSNFVKFKMR